MTPPRVSRRTLAAAALLPALAAAGCSFPPEPSVRPGDVALVATLHGPGDGPNLLPGTARTRWTLVVTFTCRVRLRAAPRWTWADEALPVVPGATILGVDYMQGLQPSGPAGNFTLAGADGFHLGLNGANAVLMARALHAQGLLPEADPNALPGTLAFSYTGIRFPARIRFYLDGTPRPGGLVVYTHAEHRWGLDMNWWRTFPVTFA